jgi:tetraacyldisaccharide 4'-kinase
MNRATTFVLLPLSGLYAVAVKARLALFKTGVLRGHRLGAPVISVGNITAGGTGKTPLVEWIARHLASEGRRVCILTRGYGRENPRGRVIVSDGESILASAADSGDEPLMLAENLVGQAAVICDRDRVSAGHWAIETLNSDVLILDDGFQHLCMARDLNIVTIDATTPWSNRLTLPAGLLREPRSGLERADCIVITRVDEAKSLDALRREIDRFIKGRPVFLSHTMSSGLRPLSNTEERSLSRGNNDSIPVAAFCAIGNPQSFFSQLRKAGYTVSNTHAFRDHHGYSQSDIDDLVNRSIAKGAGALVTTAKDEVKLRALRFDLPCYVADIEVEIEDDAKFRQLIDRSLCQSEQD